MDQTVKDEDNCRSKMFNPKKTFLSRMQSTTESESGSCSPGQSMVDLLAQAVTPKHHRDDSISQISLPDDLRISFSEIDDGSLPLEDIDFSCSPSSPDVDLTSGNIVSLDQNKDVHDDKDLHKIASAISSTSETRDSSLFSQRDYNNGANYERDSWKERRSSSGYQSSEPSERFSYKQLENGGKNAQVTNSDGARTSKSSDEGSDRAGHKRSWETVSQPMWASLTKAEAPQVSTVGSSGEVLSKKKMVSSRRGCKNKHMENKLCQVCGDVAAGFYCGAFICEACKKFYMRAYKQDKLKYVCLRDKNCVITKESRVQCQYCRFQKCVDLNMYCPKQGEDNVNKDMNMADIPCRVCSAPSSGFHFGAITCEGCKGFFRRMAKEREPEKYQCNKSGKCEINMITRNLCKACRYKQCLAAGMSVEGSRIGRQPNSVKHAISMELKHHVKADPDRKGSETGDSPIQIKQEPMDLSETETEMKSDDLLFWDEFVTSDYPVESDRDKAANQTTQIPPSSYSTDQPISAHINQPISTQLNQPVSEHLHQPISTQLNQPVSKHLNRPISTHVNQPARAHLNQPISTHLNQPDSKGLNQPISTQLNKPVRAHLKPQISPLSNQLVSTRSNQPISAHLNQPVSTQSSRPVSTHSEDFPYNQSDSFGPKNVQSQNSSSWMQNSLRQTSKKQDQTSPICTPPHLSTRPHPERHYDTKPHSQPQKPRQPPPPHPQPLNSIQVRPQAPLYRAPVPSTTYQSETPVEPSLFSASTSGPRLGGPLWGDDGGREPPSAVPDSDDQVEDFLSKIVEAGKVLQLLNYRVFDADINPTTSMNVEDIKSLFKSKYMDPRMGNHITSNVDMSIFSTKESTWNYMMTNFHHNTYITIRFAKMVPGFKSLLLNDQVKLIQYSIYPIELLNMSKVFDPTTRQYNYFTYTKEEENIMMEQFPMLNVLKDHLVHIGEMVTSFEFTDEEFALMSALLLFPAEIHGLENPKAVDDLQNKISSALQYYEEKTFPDGLTRYGVLLVRVAELVQCLLQHNLAIGLLLTHNPSIQVPQLFHELIIESIKEGQKT